MYSRGVLATSACIFSQYFNRLDRLVKLATSYVSALLICYALLTAMLPSAEERLYVTAYVFQGRASVLGVEAA
jgi:hypothetical protein